MSRPLTKTSVPGVYRRGQTYVVVLRDRSGRQFKRFAETSTKRERYGRSSLPTSTGANWARRGARRCASISRSGSTPMAGAARGACGK